MRGVAAAVAVAAVTAVLASSGPAAEPRREIVFASDWAPNLQVPQTFAVGLDGSRRTLLGGLAGFDEVRLSRDRRRFVLLRVERRPEVWVYRVESAEVDGGDRRVLLTDTTALSDVDLSPDGTRLALTRLGGADCGCQNWELVVVDLATGERRKLAEHARAPRWSPDGTRILFAERGTRIRHKRIRLVSASGGTPRDVGFGYRAEWAPDGTRLAFESYERGPLSVWVAAGDGSRARRLAAGVAASWAPNGRELAMFHGGGLEIVRLDGRSRLIARARSGSEAFFSPDGKRVAFSSYSPSCSDQVVVVDATSRTKTQLTHEECRTALTPVGWLDAENVVFRAYRFGNDSDVLLADPDVLRPEPLASTTMEELDPAWAPDGRRVAFVRGVPGLTFRGEVWTVADDGHGETRVTSPPTDMSDSTPAWSPDGRRLVFARGPQAGGRDLYLVDAAGGEPQRLTSAAGDESQPSWSPDGRLIAFTHAGPAFGDPGSVLVVEASGGAPRRLLGLAQTRAPAWSPDGRRIAFVGEEKDGSYPPALYVANADGSDPRLVVDNAAWARPAWAPDGRSLLYVRNVVVTTLHRVSLDGAGDVELTVPPPYARYDSPDWARR